MKLEIDIDEDYYKIICKRVEENKPYHSPYEYEVIADGKPLEQEPTSFQWCTGCREYDQEKHCCHRWSKVIRDTVEEMKQEQEPFINKSCVSSGVCEHDKNEVLNKIRAEIEQLPTEKCTETCRIRIDADVFKENVLAILDKYKANSEG